MELYNELGYVNIKALAETGYPFIWVCGARGTGKTYGAIDYVMQPEHTGQFFFLRRTDKEIRLLQNPMLSPFVVYGNDHDRPFAYPKIADGVGGVYDGENIDGKIHPKGDLLGYTAALSTFANMRGFNGSKVTTVIFDEFIKEPHVRPIKDEAGALMNVYETISRNRELYGHKPLQMIACANSFEMANPHFVKFGFVDRAERMRERGEELYFDKERGHLLVVLSKSPISDRKADTALYRATKGTDYAEMALHNKFADREKYSRPVSRTLKGCRPLCFVGELAIYTVKDTGRLYVCNHRTGNAPMYNNSATDLQRFRQMHGGVIWQMYMLRMIDFERISFEVVLQTYLNKA